MGCPLAGLGVVCFGVGHSGGTCNDADLQAIALKPHVRAAQPGLFSGVASTQRERRYRFSASYMALCHEAYSSRQFSTSEQISSEPDKSQSSTLPSMTTLPGRQDAEVDVLRLRSKRQGGSA